MILSLENDMTVFLDWFGHEYKFPWWDKNLRSVYLDGKAYLIFEMWNNFLNGTYGKRYLRRVI